MLKNIERDNSVGYLAWRLSNAARSALDGELGALDMTVAQMAALGSLHDEASQSTADLARDLAMTPQNMSLVVGRLEHAGYVERRPHETNRRIQRLVLTKRGREAMGRAVIVARRVDERMTADLSAADRAAFVKTLQRCVAALRVGGQRQVLAQRELHDTTKRPARAGRRKRT